LKAAKPNVSINTTLGLYFLREEYLFTSATPRIFVNPTPVLNINAAIANAIDNIETNPAAALTALPGGGPAAPFAPAAGDFTGAWLRDTINTLYGNINRLYQNAQKSGSVVVFEEHITLQLNLELSRAVKARLNKETLPVSLISSWHCVCGSLFIQTWSDPGEISNGYYEEAKPARPLSTNPQVAAAQAAQIDKVATTLWRSKIIEKDEMDDAVIFRAASDRT
jgi:hypothetical protein